jgi:hypothetical protein
MNQNGYIQIYMRQKIKGEKFHTSESILSAKFKRRNDTIITLNLTKPNR